MKVSIFTPTHNLKFLKELQESILANTYQNWEWVILLNNGAKYKSDDNRIKIFNSKTNSEFVGALKKEACSLATGEILVEVDHDDMITPDCLEKIVEAFKQDESIGFVYSDDAKLSDKFKPYNSAYGWTYRMFKWKGQALFAMNNQPITPGRLGYIYFAPDHVRAWRTSVYWAAGGHNQNLSILDDLDLMHRTYLISKFHYIKEVLYIYRIDGNNTWLKRNKQIQIDTVKIYLKNVRSLAMRFADINGLLKVDLCGGIRKANGFISVDKKNGDINADLDTRFPFKDNSVGVLRAQDAMEHLIDKQKTMQEIHRVLAPGGILLSCTPSTDGRGAWQDPTHVSFWNENSFWYYTRKEQMQFINNTQLRFRECYLKTEFLSDFNRKNNISHVVAHLEKL